MKSLGVLFVVLGVLALLYGGIEFSRQSTANALALSDGIAVATPNLPLSPIAGGIVMVGGLVLLLTPRRRIA